MSTSANEEEKKIENIREKCKLKNCLENGPCIDDILLNFQTHWARKSARGASRSEPHRQRHRAFELILHGLVKLLNSTQLDTLASLVRFKTSTPYVSGLDSSVIPCLKEWTQIDPDERTCFTKLFGLSTFLFLFSHLRLSIAQDRTNHYVPRECLPYSPFFFFQLEQYLTDSSIEKVESKKKRRKDAALKSKGKPLKDEKVFTDSVYTQIITNDGSSESSIKLLALVHIFAEQLPKMPRTYILRLVLDRRHRSLCLLRRNDHVVVGGICIRPFPCRDFAEIVFCAVLTTHQVKGYGNRMMNDLKEYMKSIALRYFLTYADNYAIGFFEKQGFTKSLTLKKTQYSNYIKDYDGGTLMECRINFYMNYSCISEIVQLQRQCITDLINQTTSPGPSYKGLSFPAHEALHYSEIPGLVESGYRPIKSKRNSKRTMRTVEQTPFQKQCFALLSHLQQSKDSWPFLQPVDTKQVQDYCDIIKTPMDFATMEMRVVQNFYRTWTRFDQDVQLVIDNCKTYNDEETSYYKCAVSIETLFCQLKKQRET